MLSETGAVPVPGILDELLLGLGYGAELNVPGIRGLVTPVPGGTENAEDGVGVGVMVGGVHGA